MLDQFFLSRMDRTLVPVVALLLWVTTFNTFGQTQPSKEILKLVPGQRLERELVGADTHHYKFDLRAKEFFQVRVEQMGIDVVIKLFDVNHNAVATMDSPNGNQGPETITFVSEKSGRFTLEITGLDAKAGKGNYSIRREALRRVTPKDKQRVESERVFVEGLAAREIIEQQQTAIAKLETALLGWRQLHDSYMAEITAQQIRAIQEAQFNRDARPLPLNETIDRQIKGGEIHAYTVELKAGAVMQLDAQEKGIDVGLAVVDGTGQGSTVNYGGGYDRETLTFVAKAAGPYLVSLLTRRAGSGGYQLTTRIAETATDSDRDRIEASRLILEGLTNSDGETLVRSKIAKWEKALSLWEKVHDDYWRGYTSHLLASNYEKIGEKRKALDYYGLAQSMFAAVPDRRREIQVLKGASALYQNVGEAKKAAEYFSREATLWNLEQNKFGEALAYESAARVYQKLGETDLAIKSFQKVLPIYQELKINPNLVVVYAVLALLNNLKGNVDEAITYAELSLATDATMPLETNNHEKKDYERFVRQSHAHTHLSLGTIYINQRKWEKALQHLDLARSVFEHESGDAGEALSKTILAVGLIHSFRFDWDKALASYKEALSLAKRADDKITFALTANQIGAVFLATSEYRKAIEYLRQAVAAIRAIKRRNPFARRFEASISNNIGIAYHALGEYGKALESYNHSLALLKQRDEFTVRNGSTDDYILAVVLQYLGDTNDQLATTYNNIASLHMSLSEYRKAFDVLNLALETYRLAPPNMKKLARNHSTEARLVINIGIASAKLGNTREALTYYDQGLKIGVTIGDKSIEAFALKQVAITLMGLGDTKVALEHIERSLSLYREVGDKSEEAMLLTGFGVVYNTLGDRQKALEYHDLALKLSRKIGNKQVQIIVLSNTAATYAELGESRLSLDYLRDSVTLARVIGDKEQEAIALNNTAGVYADIGDKRSALLKYQHAATIFHTLGDKRSEATVLANISDTYFKLGDRDSAVSYLDRSLPLSRLLEDKQQEAVTLSYLGRSYSRPNEKRIAMEVFGKSLALTRSLGDKGREAFTLKYLMSFWRQQGNHRLAVFFGKQSVNKRQDLRRGTLKLDNETQKSFLRRIKDSYRELAEILIEEGELAQAVQVLNIYQDQQFFDFGHDPGDSAKQLALSSREAVLASRYDKAGERVQFANEALLRLKLRMTGNHKSSDQELAQLTRLEADLKDATDDFQAVLTDAESEFSQPRSEEDNVSVTTDVSEFQNALNEISKATKRKTVGLYTLIGPKNFHILLVTSDRIKSFSSPITAEDFNEKILQFYAVLRNPGYDPRPLGKQLYDIIVKPLEADLRQTGAQTLVWALDGNLRYVPMAALSPDGGGYLVEKYQNAVFTRVDRARMSRPPSAVWTGTGFSSSHAQRVKLFETEIPFCALPGITAEMHSIFNEALLKGAVFADAKFTRTTFYEALKARRPVVHISSHFLFRSGDDSHSFLVLGDGTALTLREMKAQGRLFEQVELLTLSACNTGAQLADADGREIDGFAELAQRLGAAAVMATLWSVSDSSTPSLMHDFYQLRQQRSEITKAETLQKAQLGLLYGSTRVRTIQESAPCVTKGTSGLSLQLVRTRSRDQRNDARQRADLIYVSQANAPYFREDPAKPYAHPYYWSPFVLFGNWR